MKKEKIYCCRCDKTIKKPETNCWCEKCVDLIVDYNKKQAQQELGKEILEEIRIVMMPDLVKFTKITQIINSKLEAE